MQWMVAAAAVAAVVAAVPDGSLLLHPADVVDVEVVLVTRVTSATHGCRNIRMPPPIMLETKIDFLRLFDVDTFLLILLLFIVIFIIDSLSKTVIPNRGATTH